MVFGFIRSMATLAGITEDRQNDTLLFDESASSLFTDFRCRRKSLDTITVALQNDRNP
jgi:hypothetical protein